MNNLKTILQQIPKMPGVYLFKDNKQDIIYIGKAKNLFNRVHSYFINHDLGPHRLSHKIADIEYFVTNNEIEALLLENNLIKKYLPRFNIRLKDAKTYPMIKISRENLPRIMKCREKINHRHEYFGPYVNVKELNALLNILRKIFKFRTCKKQFKPPYQYAPCLNFHIGYCCAPCAGYVSEEEYLKRINNARKILLGKMNEIKAILQQEMLTYSNILEFENAAVVRDHLQLINKFEQVQLINSNQANDADFIGIHFEAQKAAVSIIQERNGIISDKKNFMIDHILESATDSSIINDFIKTYYLNITQLPVNIFIEVEINDKDSILNILKAKLEKKINITLPRTSRAKRLLLLAKENAALFFEERQYTLEKIHHLRELKKVLKLNKLPRVIECFDIATLNGQYNTAALVSFKDGTPDKSAYRKFNIQGKGHPDDYAMMEETIGRRYQYLKNENLNFPDLIVVDGGRGQLNSALKMLDILELTIPVIGLAKKHEHIFIKNKKKPLVLSHHSYALKLLQAVRDEAHRFSNVSLSKRYKNSLLKSELLKIEGIGKKRVTLLLKKFKSIPAMKKKSLADLASIEGIGENLAKTIFDYFHNKT